MLKRSTISVLLALCAAPVAAKTVVNQAEGFTTISKRPSFTQQQKFCIATGYRGPTTTPGEMGRASGGCFPACPGDIVAVGCDTVDQCNLKAAVYCAANSCPPVEGTSFCAQAAVDVGLCTQEEIDPPGQKKRTKARNVCSGKATAFGLDGGVCALGVPVDESVKWCARESVRMGFCPMAGSGIPLPSIEDVDENGDGEISLDEEGCASHIDRYLWSDVFDDKVARGATIWASEMNSEIPESKVED